MCSGVIGVIWAILWFFLVYNTPAQHPRISTEERDYIEKVLVKKTEQKVCRHVIHELLKIRLKCLS